MVQISKKTVEITVLELTNEEAQAVRWALGDMNDEMYPNVSLAVLGMEVYSILKDAEII